MAITTRQSGLLVSEDWQKLYQTFRNADFQSYDYETLRKSMIDYIRLYYPEDFNDFIESSEFVALIDTIAFMGQSIAFRGDLNARENFIDTAERRDSILKLAKLISYNPKRNTPASGSLKFDSISTTETVYDSASINLAGLVIEWNDVANSNWLEQFSVILNSAMVDSQVIGKPSNTQIINGISNAEYQINLGASPTAIAPFSAAIEGISMRFEAISATSVNALTLVESDPRPNQPFNIIFKNDGLGHASANTGFFMSFKQGELKSSDFTFSESIPNRIYGVDVNNINNDDVWLYKLNANLTVDKKWKQVPSVGNTNVIYNKDVEKDIYQVVSRANDQVDLVFGDGAFANIPQGIYKLYYRISNGLEYKITPDEMQGIIISMDYISRSGRVETINIRASLQGTVANSSGRETLDEIKQKAPQQYYTQDRMVTGEDYNILPYTLFNNVLKAKAVNRTSSGVSRYLDVVDVTGKYSSTNIFAEDGMLYKEDVENTFTFSFDTTGDISRVIADKVGPILSEQATKQLFYEKYPRINLLSMYWHHSTSLTNGSTGYFVDTAIESGLHQILQVGEGVSSTARYVKQGALIKFSPGSGNYYDARNRIQVGTPRKAGDKFFIYAAVQTLVGNGTNGGNGNLANNTGPVVINEVVPAGSQAIEIFSVFNNSIAPLVITNMTSLIESNDDFGLRYNIDTSAWEIVSQENLSIGEFSLSGTGDTSGTGLDASWLLRFSATGKVYTVHYRSLEYIFESVQETNFYFDEKVKVFDPKTGETIRDHINVLKVNSSPDTSEPLFLDYTWQVASNIVDTDGYASPSKLKVTFPDSDNDGIPDNPEIFDLVVSPQTNPLEKFVYFKDTFGYDNFITKTPVDVATVESSYGSANDINSDILLFTDGQLFYIPALNSFHKVVITGTTYSLVDVTDHTAKIGRQSLYFQYRHNSPSFRRIDPSANNIIDIFILTKQYAVDYTAWIRDLTETLELPSPPSSEELSVEFNALENFKSVTDTLIYNPPKFKPVFGIKADIALRATFKVIKNPNIVISDNEIKTSVISAINAFFDLANWDFGETFFFSELSAYLHSTLAPNVASVIIVPSSTAGSFGGLQQINAEFNEIIVSSATVDDVRIISAITQNQLN